MDRIRRQVEAVTRRTTSRKSSVPGTESLIMSMSSTPAVGPLYQIFRSLLGAPETIPLSVRFTKRSIDLLAALIGLLLFALLFPALALAIYWDSPGPIFYRQRRAAALKQSSGGARHAFAEFDM